MAAPPNAPCATLNGSSQQKAQATCPAAGHFPRCVRICIKCQKGTPQPSGCSLPNPAQNALQKQQHSCQGSCLACAFKNNGHAPFPVRGPVCIPLDNLSDQSSQGDEHFERQAMERTPSDEVNYMILEKNVQQICESAIAESQFSRPPLHGMLMQEKITEEATTDETTEKTSFMPSQRDSMPSTWQDVSRLGPQQEIEDASEEEDSFNEALPSQGSSEGGFRSAGMQASFAQDEQYESPPIVADKLGDLSKGVQGPDEVCRESNSDRNLFLNECTSPERAELDLGEPLSNYDFRIRQADNVSCQRVMDCLRRCSEKLEEIQYCPNNAPSSNDIREPQQNPLTVERGMNSEPPVAPPDVIQTIVGYTQVSSFGKDLCSCIEQCTLQAAAAPPCFPQPAVVREYSGEETPPLDTLAEFTIPVKSSASKLSMEKFESVPSKQKTSGYSAPQSEYSDKKSISSKDQTSRIESSSKEQSDTIGQGFFTPQTEDSTKKSSLSKDQTSKLKFCSKQQSGTLEQLPSDLIVKKSISSRDTSNPAVLQQSAKRLAHLPSDSTVVKCKLTRENLSLCKQLCDKLNQTSLQETTPQRTPSKQLETMKFSQSNSVSRQKLPETIKKAPRYESPFRRAASQHDAILKKLIPRQESATQKSLSRQESALKKSVPQWKKSASQAELVSKQSVGGRSDSKTQLTEKPSVSTAQSKGYSTQSSKQLASESVDNKWSKTPTLSRNSGTSQMQSSYYQKKRPESMQQLPEKSKSIASGPFPGKSSATKSAIGSTPKPRPQSADKEKTPTQSQPRPDKISLGSQPKSEKNPHQSEPKSDKTPLGSQPKSEKNPDQSQPKTDKPPLGSQRKSDKTPLQSEPKSDKSPPESQPKSNSHSTRSKSDSKRTKSESEEGTDTEKERNPLKEEKSSSSATDEANQRDDVTGQSGCVQSYYLPLYQCPYCQQVTPCPFSCEFGFPSCPSPSDLCQYQLCSSSTGPCVQYPYPIFDQPCQPPNTQENQFEPVKPCPQTEQKDGPQSCEIKSCPSRKSCSTGSASNPCTASCQPCDTTCETPCQTCETLPKTNKMVGRCSFDDGSRKNRGSIESDESALHSQDPKTAKLESSDYPLKGKFKDRSSAVSNSSESSSIKRNEKEGSQKEKTMKDGNSAKKMDMGTRKGTDGRKKSAKEQGRSEKARREPVIRKITYRDGSVNSTLDKRRKSTRIQSGNELEEKIPKKSLIKSQTPPHQSSSPQLEYRCSGIPMSTSEEGVIKPRDLDEESQTERQNDTKMTRATDKSNRSSNQSSFQSTYFHPAGSHGMARSTQNQVRPSLQDLSPKTALRKAQSKTEPRRINKIAPNASYLLRGERLFDSRGEARNKASSIVTDGNEKDNARCPQTRSSFGNSNEESSQKSTTEKKCGQIKTRTNSHVPSLDVTSLRKFRRSRYLDHKNVSSHHLPNIVGPHRAICPTKRHAVKKRLDLSNDEINSLSKSPERNLLTQQPDIRNNLPSNVPSASSEAQNLAAHQPNCCSYMNTQSSCTECIQGASLPDHHLYCAHLTANMPHRVCPLYLHLKCPKGSCRTPGRRRHTKAKPLSLRPQRTRHIVM